ncbi:MAG: glutamine amidotransferase [Hyphomicrobiales bacterium]|nr:glutamine amidotransferase [Hyphomicrobiales bacterium]
MNRKRLVLFRHNHVPADDRIAGWAYFNGYEIDVRYPFSGDDLDGLAAQLGDESDIVGTVVYGGPFNAFEHTKYPFLVQEQRWIEAAMEAEIPLLGICQGAQQIAHTLGVWVGPYEPEVHEFGYYQLEPSDAGKREEFLENPIHVCQAHYHTFDLPDQAVHLARSAAYENQAFRIGEKVYGFQFHAEQTVENFRRWQDSKVTSYGQPGAQTREQQNQLMAQHDQAQGEWFYGFLDKLFGPAK